MSDGLHRVWVGPCNEFRWPTIGPEMLVYEGPHLDLAVEAAAKAEAPGRRPHIVLGDTPHAICPVKVTVTRTAEFFVVAGEESLVRETAEFIGQDDPTLDWQEDIDVDVDFPVSDLGDVDTNLWVNGPEIDGSYPDALVQDDPGRWVKPGDLLSLLAEGARAKRSAAEAEKRRGLGLGEPVPYIKGQIGFEEAAG